MRSKRRPKKKGEEAPATLHLGLRYVRVVRFCRLTNLNDTILRIAPQVYTPGNQ